MKQLFFTTILITLLFATQGFAQQSTAESKLEFQRYDSYFEKNSSNLKGNASYLAFSNQETFDKVFGAAATMGQNNFLPENVFNSKLVIAAIKRGSSIQTYELEKVTEKKRKLYLWYKATNKEAKGASYSSPLIVAVNKSKYSQVIFMENGKKAGTVLLSKNKQY